MRRLVCRVGGSNLGWRKYFNMKILAQLLGGRTRGREGIIFEFQLTSRDRNEINLNMTSAAHSSVRRAADILNELTLPRARSS